MTARVRFLTIFTTTMLLVLAIAGGFSLASGDSRVILQHYRNLARKEFQSSSGSEGLPVSLFEGLRGKKTKLADRKGMNFDEQIAVVLAERRKALGDNRAKGNWPLKGPASRVTSLFNEDRGHRKHAGIDISARINTPVVAVLPGKFYKDDQGDEGLGKYVYLIHDNGLVTYYGHLQGWADVKEGEEVAAGTVIGWSGNSGYSTGPHLHFAVKAREGFIDPLALLKQPEIVTKDRI